LQTNSKLLRGAVIAATAGLAIAAAGPAEAATPAHSRQFHVLGAANVEFLGEHSIGSGSYVASWLVDGSKITVAGPAGLTVRVSAAAASAASGSVTASVTAPSRPKAQSLAELATTPTSAQSIRNDAYAVGYTPAQAARVSPATAGAIYDGWCVDVYGDSNHAHGHGCIERIIIQQNGGDWYLGDEISGTGNDTGSSNSLTGFQVRDDYPNGNTIVQYSPSGTVNRSSCGTFNPSLTYKAISISSSSDVCADKVQPALNGSRGYGVHWSGCDGFDEAEGLSSVSVVHSPSGASVASTLNATVWWASGFGCPLF
jgi:hypothetical protein